LRGGPISRILSTLGRNPKLDGHSSWSDVATAPLAANPDRRAKTGPHAVPIWHCSRWGLPCRRCYQPRGGLLPHRFTLAQKTRRNGHSGGLFSVALSLGFPRPGVTRHRCLVESGLSSHERSPERPCRKRPSGPPRKRGLRGGRRPVNGKARGNIRQHGHISRHKRPLPPRPEAQAHRA